MDINKGFQIDEPNLFIPWGIEEMKLTNLFISKKLTHVTTGYYTTTCKSLNGLDCELGFHFAPRFNGHLKELEFFRRNYDDPKKSFDDFQSYFEKQFGEPTYSRKGSEGFNDYKWVIGNTEIIHNVFDRFGPEEHMRIIRL
ncbi:MAG TPA: hypothetical protein VK498_04690 [Ferruginibacter sp.]|nr:hypothetical protein [Ferruginibacter sp.]